MKVFLNPGHAPNGVNDPGAVNPLTGDRECDLVLICGNLLKAELESRGVTVFMEQSDNLCALCEHERIWGGSIFVSLHCNACHSHRARGVETWYKTKAGKKLAFAIQEEIVANQRKTIDRGIKATDNLYVLNQTQAPAVLVELGFIDNMDDLKLLKNDMQTYARSIAKAICAYLVRN